LQDFLESISISIGSYPFDLFQLIGILVSIVLTFVFYRISIDFLKSYELKHETTIKDQKKNHKLLALTFILIAFIIALSILKIDPTLGNEFNLTLSKIIIAVVIVLLARVADNIISRRLDLELKSRTDSRDLPHSGELDSKGANIVQYIIIVICGYFLLKNFKFLNYTFPLGVRDGIQLSIQVSDIFIAALVLLIAQLFVWLWTNFFLQGFYKRKEIDLGKQYAYNQLFSYLVYFFAFIFALQHLGINMTVLWTGAAALLVGIGIALQQTISDFFSGIVLLFERSVQVGDFLEIGSESGTLLRIGLRASSIETREFKTIVIPNSKLVNNNVVNWSNIQNLTRFEIAVGVAYGTDTTLVQQLLLKSTEASTKIVKNPKPFVRLMDFGDNALQFRLYFFSKEFIAIEDIKSKVRLNIDKYFRENNITIPFPQTDVWIKDSKKLQ
jgi:small-conductance mechanosensitive channel